MKAEDVNKIIGIAENYELPSKLLDLMLSNQRENIFNQFLELEQDLSFDWFTDYFQQEHGDRDKLKQDFTPKEVAHLVNSISGPATSVADICAGTGGLTIKKWNEQREAECFYYMEEFASRAIPILIFNIAIRNMNAEIVHCDALTQEVFGIYRIIPGDRFSTVEKVTERTGRTDFDAVIMNPPYSLTWSGDKSLINDPRFSGYGVAPKSKADYAFILHGLAILKETGTLVAILPHGVLFRGAAEGEIRTELIRRQQLETVIGLPDNLFLNTSIPVALLIFKKKREDEDIYFIDASKEFIKGKAQNNMSDEHVDNILTAYRLRRNIDKFSNLAKPQEIESNDYNLNIPRYVDTFEPEPIVPMQELLDSLIQTEREIQTTEIELLNFMRQLVGTTPEQQRLHEESVTKFERLIENRQEFYKQMELF